MEEINNGAQLDPDQLPAAIEDSLIDPEQIMSDIRERLTQFREDKAYDDHPLPSYGDATYPDKPDDIPYDMELYHHLDLANVKQSQTGTSLDIRDNAINRVPIIGSLWRSLQTKLHGPALYYANRAAERQALINGELVEVLNRLLASLQGQQREIDALKEELRRLHQQDR